MDSGFDFVFHIHSEVSFVLNIDMRLFLHIILTVRYFCVSYKH